MTREELKEILKQDLERYGNTPPTFKDWFVGNESWFIFHLIRHVRYQEYYGSKKGIYRLMYIYHWLKYKRLSLKLHITIYPGTVAGGLRIYHVGDYIHIGPNCKIGNNCTIISGTVFGNKNEKSVGEAVYVGNNCYFGIGAKILGSVNIGNNVIVGANAVVIKDIPDNCIVGGIPAKILKKNI